MSRQIIKWTMATLSMLSGIVWFSFACSTSSSSWEATFADSTCSIPIAINTVKDVIARDAFYSEFLDAQRSNPWVIYVPTSIQRAYYNAWFTGLVYNLWHSQNIKTSTKLASALQWVINDMWSRYTNPSLSNDERTKFAYLYYLTKASISALKWTPDTTTNNPQGFVLLQDYTTLNGRSYTLWHNDVFFVFSRGNNNTLVMERRSRSLQDLIDYLEYQNRLIVQAPNGKRYGLWKHGWYIKINRNNGTVIGTNFISVDEAENMLSICASNEPIAPQDRYMCGYK